MPSSTRADARFVDGDLPDYTSFVTGIEAVVQRIRFRVLLHKGEWFADPTAGLPWKQWVQTKPAPVSIIHAYVKRAIATTPGVARILHSKATFDPELRRVSIEIEAEINNELVELEYVINAIEYGNVSPYVTYRVLGRAA